MPAIKKYYFVSYRIISNTGFEKMVGHQIVEIESYKEPADICEVLKKITEEIKKENSLTGWANEHKIWIQQFNRVT